MICISRQLQTIFPLRFRPTPFSSLFLIPYSSFFYLAEVINTISNFEFLFFLMTPTLKKIRFPSFRFFLSILFFFKLFRHSVNISAVPFVWPKFGWIHIRFFLVAVLLFLSPVLCSLDFILGLLCFIHSSYFVLSLNLIRKIYNIWSCDYIGVQSCKQNIEDLRPVQTSKTCVLIDIGSTSSTISSTYILARVIAFYLRGKNKFLSPHIIS